MASRAPVSGAINTASQEFLVPAKSELKRSDSSADQGRAIVVALQSIRRFHNDLARRINGLGLTDAAAQAVVDARVAHETAKDELAAAERTLAGTPPEPADEHARQQANVNQKKTDVDTAARTLAEAEGQLAAAQAAVRGTLEAARLRTGPCVFRAGDKLERLETAFYRREALPVGETFAGPAVILQTDSTTVAPPGTRVTAETGGNLIIKLGG